MLLLKKQNINETKREYEEVCQLFTCGSDLFNVIGENKLGLSVKITVLILSLIKNIFIKLSNKIDFNIYYCSKQNFNFIKNKKYILYKNRFKKII